MENKIEARHLNLYYGQKHALKDVSLDIKENNPVDLAAFESYISLTFLLCQRTAVPSSFSTF